MSESVWVQRQTHDPATTAGPTTGNPTLESLIQLERLIQAPVHCAVSAHNDHRTGTLPLEDRGPTAEPGPPR